MNIFTKSKWLLPGLFLVQLMACSKHDTKPSYGAPTVALSSTDYKVKIGTTGTLTAQVGNAIDAVYTWKQDGKILSTNLTCPFDGSQVGEYFVTFRVDAENGSMEQQVKVTVADKLPPQINMPTNIIAFLRQDNPIAAIVSYADSAKYVWRLNGTIVSTDSIYNAHATVQGSNILTLQVTNSDGSDLKLFGLGFIPPPPAELYFDDGHYRLAGDVSTKRLSIPLGKSLILAPVAAHIPSAALFQWTVNGVARSSSSVYLTYTPAAKGTALITVTAAGVTASVNVECVDAEGTFFRAPSAGSKYIANTAFEVIPAPGQFTAYGPGSSASDALNDFLNGMTPTNTQWITSLGAYGGYAITGFDHSVSDVAGKPDIGINGNQFAQWSEPGIVWVSQDENGNGLPDDTWYELKGSETGNPATNQRYAITYYKPSAPGQDVLWVDNIGGKGSVDYNQYHSQPYYFPMFINTDSYTLVGTCLQSTMMIGDLETSAGYAWGYVDNVGDGTPSTFKIEDAIRADGTPANLKYIDFVKVHTGMTGKGAAVGEISTETGAPFDLNLNKQ
ncbi:MAG TPA: PKD-like domain-containing protein [Puia sp.]|jgi:hypothetical protein